jgi:DNA mismatch repair protein MutL
MSSQICLLADDLINKIAAGEVIESPSCVVKELIENALDAHATKIGVEISGGGLLFIRISDDGIGMNEDDLKMCMLRHATSKIKSLSDLEKVMTMGFRGEALSSIASISKMKIESGHKKIGRSINNEDNEVHLSSREKGTLIEVRSLFYNVPARKKFQKSVGILTAEIIKVVNQLSLANPHVGFALSIGDKKVLDVKGNDKDFKTALSFRIKEVLKENFFKELKYVEVFQDSFKIQGFLAVPSFTKLNKTYQYLFVNGRLVFSNLVASAIKEGYGTRIGEKEHPVFILHLTIDPHLIDVNVHPQKKQIKFCEEEFLRELLQKAVEKTFQEKEEKLYLNPFVFQKEATFSSKEPLYAKEMTKKDLFEEKEEVFLIKEIGLIKHFFLLEWAQALQKKIVIVDLKAASASLIFHETLLSLKENNKKEIQRLSFPILFDLLKEEISILQDNLKTISQMGLEIRIIGEKTIAIDGYSSLFHEEDLSDILSSILEDLKVFGKTQKDKELFVKNFAKKICRFAKTRKKGYTIEEARAIFEKIRINNNFFDPLGERVLIELEEEDLSKLFSNKKGESCLTSKE